MRNHVLSAQFKLYFASLCLDTCFRIFVASSLPFIACFVQWQLWSFLPPVTWLFFYPTVFFSASIGGLIGGLLATLISIGLGGYIFMQPQLSWAIADPRHYLSIIVFGIMGALFSLFHARLHKTNLELARLHALDLESVQAKLNQTLEAAHAGIWEWNIQTNQNEWSDGIYELYGLEKHSVQPSYEAWLETVHVDDKEDVIAKLNQAVQHSSEMKLEWRVANLGSEHERWLMASGKPFLTAIGMPCLYRGIVVDISQRKIAEQNLIQSEQRLNFALETLKVGAWDVDLETRKVHRSKQHAQIFGYTTPPTEWSGEIFLNHVIPEDKERIKLAFQSANAQFLEHDIEFRIKRADGQVRWLWAKGRHRYDDKGHPKQLGGVILDIQDRKDAERTIKTIGDELLKTQKLAGLGSWQWDLITNLQTWSEETYRLYGLEPCSSPPEYTEIQSYFTPESWIRISDAVKAAISNGTLYECDLELIRASGEHCWVTARGAAVKDTQGSVVKLHGTIQDITERKHSEITLLASEQRFRRLFHDAPIAQALVDIDGSVLNTNARFEKLFGYTASDVPNLSEWWPKAYPDPDYRESVMTKWHAAVAYALETKTDIPEQEYQVACSNSDVRDVIFSGIVVENEFMVTLVDVTEQKKAEALLHDQERLLADSQAVAHIGSWKLDFKTDQIIWSQETFKLLGLSPAQTSPPSLEEFYTLISPEDRLALKSWHRAMLINGDVSPLELNTRKINGEARWLLIIGKPDRDLNGEVINIIGTVQDITERKKLENERLHLETRYRALFDQAIPDAIFVHDHNGKFIDVNRMACISSGYSKEELLDMNVLDLEMDFDLSLAQAQWSGVKHGVTKILYGHHFRKDGTSFPVEINFGVLEDKGLRLYIALVRDITNRVKTEERLILQSKALEAAGNAIMISNRRGKIEWVNPQFTLMTGYSAEESIGQTTDQLLKSHILEPELHRQIWKSISNGEIWHGEINYIRKDGTLYPEEQTITPVFGDNGLIQHYIAIKQDITERKRNEAELKEYRTSLEKLVEERTKDLKVARKEAERLSEVKSSFLANMSHEIRSPMNAVLGYCYLLGLRPLENDSRQLVQKIHNAGNTLLSIINDILDFSKIEAGRIEIEQVPFSLPDILEQLADLMSSVATGKNLELIIVPPPVALEKLIGDGLRLQQVLINLLSNAIKFTDQGEVILTISIEAELDNQVQLRFSVSDTGIGISPDQQEIIFSAFSQADTSITRRFGGSGLGLSISHQLVHLMGGELKVTSKIRQGSEFWFILPLQIDHTEASKYVSLNCLDLLVADDCATARASIENTAKNFGWSVSSVDSGENAIRHTEASWHAASPYDVLILDWKMLGLDGLATAQAIKQSLLANAQQLKKMPIVIMVSAYNREELMSQPGMMWIDAVLSKPVTPSSLYNAIAQVLTDRQQISGFESFKQSMLPVQQRLAGLRILGVDDSEFNREVIKGILESEGAIVYLAEDGEDALNWLTANPEAVDIVLMDVQMPRMDGYATTRLMRQQPQWQKLPIVAITAGAFTAFEDAACESGMDGFISKPFNVDKLINQIQNLTAMSSSKTENNDLQLIATNNYQILKSPSASDSVLPGLDMDGSKKLWRNEAMYLSYLAKFKQDYSDAGNQIAEAIKSCESAAAMTLAHKLKGVAGNLSLPEVFLQASNVDACLIKNYPLDNSVNLLQAAIDQACRSIGIMHNQTNKKSLPISNEHEDSESLISLLSQLLETLDKDNPAFVEPLMHQIDGKLTKDDFDIIQNLITDFNFRSAEASVRNLLAGLKSN